MKIFYSILIALLISTNLFAQSNQKFVVAVNFRSICCGVPDSEPLFKAIKTFKKKNNIKRKIAYTHIGPLGKEGEYMLGFTLKELTKKQKLAFIKMVKRVAPTMKDRGTVSVEEHVTADDQNTRATATQEKI